MSINALVLLACIINNWVRGNFLEFLQCTNLCQIQKVIPYQRYGNTNISDCHCDFNSTQVAVKAFFSPLLNQLCDRSFFRYFWVDLEKKCPFWDEEGKCFMEACSVCACDEKDLPFEWAQSTSDTETSNPSDMQRFDFGWISSESNMDPLQNLEEVKITKLDDWGKQRDIDWIDMSERNDKSEGIFVNLAQNPERFTGYSGFSARRVWDAIQKENCFGAENDQCNEKRVFYRLMSGLQASISAHISKEYYYPEGRWGPNYPLFNKALGDHKDRVNNLFFTFLFVLRAVVKSKDSLLKYDFGVGEESTAIKQLIEELVSAKLQMETSSQMILTGDISADESANLFQPTEQCRNGFDESLLFQVPKSAVNWEVLSEKEAMKEEFRARFRNISRIMDCVTCEKCRLWGKIQILGLGASIKILLTSEEDISRNGLLSRQEVIALINTLNQLCKSVEFASDALSNNQSLESRIFPTLLSNARTIIIIFTCMLLIFIAYFRAYIFSKSKAD